MIVFIEGNDKSTVFAALRAYQRSAALDKPWIRDDTPVANLLDCDIPTLNNKGILSDDRLVSLADEILAKVQYGETVIITNVTGGIDDTGEVNTDGRSVSFLIKEAQMDLECRGIKFTVVHVESR